MGHVGPAAHPAVLVHAEGSASLLLGQCGQVGPIPPVQRGGRGDGDEQEDVPAEEEGGREAARAPDDGEGDADEEEAQHDDSTRLDSCVSTGYVLAEILLMQGKKVGEKTTLSQNNKHEYPSHFSCPSSQQAVALRAGRYAGIWTTYDD